MSLRAVDRADADPPFAIAPGWRTLRRAAGHAAALAIVPYLVIKVVWVAAALAGADWYDESTVDTSDWVVLNTVTVAMAAAGIGLGLALARPWGMRLPASPIAFGSWIGTGFLVSLLPFAVATAVLAPFAGEDDVTEPGSRSSIEVPGWEVALIAGGFIGMAIGLAIAVPIYARERWPEAFIGRVDDAAPQPDRYRHLSVLSARLAALAAALFAVVGLSWSVGGTLGLRTEHRDLRDLNWYLLHGVLAAWALVGAWAIWTLANRNRKYRLWIPMTLAWVASGSLFAWSSWKLPLLAYAAAESEFPEHPSALISQQYLAVVAGLLMLITTLIQLSDRAAALDR